MTGAASAFTVSATVLVVAAPLELVKTARYRLPLMVVVVLASVSVVPVAPDMLVNAPFFTLTCHCTVGVSHPLAAAVNVAVVPAVTVDALGCVVTTGAARALTV